MKAINTLKKYNAKTLLALAVILSAGMLFPSPVFSQEQNDINDERVNVYTLSNGLTLYTKEDDSSALTRIELAVRGGFSAQSAKNAGFVSLYTKLFLQAAKEADPAFNENLITVSCGADSATYTTETSPYNTEKILKALGICCTNPSFPDKQLSQALTEMKQQVIDYDESTAGYVNSAIDSRIFAEEPWKHDSGIYPSLFTSNTVASARTQLLQISATCYTPENSALFISGNIDSEKICTLVEKYFGKWSSTKVSVQHTNPLTIDRTRKRFVITDPAFTSDMTQIVVQYTGLSRSTCDIIAAAFTSEFSTYTKAVLSSNTLSVRDQDYLNAASAQKNGSSRLILQAILEEPYSFATVKPDKNTVKPDCVAQAQEFLDTAAACAKLSKTDFYRAQNLIVAKYKSITGNTSMYMNLLADYWALSSSQENFSANNRTLLEDMQILSWETLTNEVTSDQPYVFLLVNEDTYKKNKKSFDKSGYTLITRKNASWYSDQLKLKHAETQTVQAMADTEPEAEQSVESKSKAFLENNRKQFTQTKLQNNIPVIIKKNPESQSVTVSIAINGGELESPKNERHLRTVLINAFATNIQKEILFMRNASAFSGTTEVKAWTEETVSYITINCIKEDIHQVLLAASNAIVFGEVNPSLADDLVYDEKNQWSLKSGSMVYQMTCEAMNSLYSGTKYQKFFDANSKILKDSSFTSVSKAYTELLNASLYTILITGDVDENTIQTAAENTFGTLREQTPRQENEIAVPVFSRINRKVRLHHTYTTDIPAELAGDRPMILIPTTDFYDPVEYWYKAPLDNAIRPVYNALLYELNYLLQSKVDSKIICSAKQATYKFPAGCIVAEKVLYTKNVDDALKTATQLLNEELNDKNEQALVRIKSTWLSETLSATSTNEGTADLIQKSAQSGNPMQYLEDYVKIDNLTFEELQSVATQFFSTDPLMKLYSKDSK